MVRSTGLYLALLLGANAAAADISALREGDMRKLVVHEAPIAASDEIFTREDGTEGSLADYAGQIVLVNFWATWCAPCRAEMPMLDTLQQELGGEEFQVVTIATGRNPAPALEEFFVETGIEALPLHIDPRQALARGMGVLGLPVTVILDRDGQEVARLQGEADWSSESARAILEALIAAE